MENLPSWLIVPTAVILWFLVKDKLAGVKEIDMKLSDKIDKLLEMVYELKAAVKGIDDLTNRMSRAENRLDSLESRLKND
jgi:DNA repair ATPase RecN